MHFCTFYQEYVRTISKFVMDMQIRPVIVIIGRINCFMILALVLSGYIIFISSQKIVPGGKNLKKEEKQEEPKPVTWEVADPKPPVVQSGHLEQHRAN